MRGVRPFLHFLLAAIVLLAAIPGAAQEGTTHQVAPGDTWAALAARYGVGRAALQASNFHPNSQREPTIGSLVTLPQGASPQTGRLLRPAGGLLSLAVRYNQNPWVLAWQNGFPHPYRPGFYRPVLIPEPDIFPRELPPGFETLELSRIPAQPGQAIAVRGITTDPISATITLDALPISSFRNENRLVGVGATGAFFPPGAPELAIRTSGAPLWSQPWRFEPGEWDYDQLTLTGAAAEIDQAAIIAERERLFALWTQETPAPQWQRPFQVPIVSFLQISSRYGARRSYNGGPYRTYHEGVDFSAYEGTPVYATAGGTVVLAEELYVRGGAVIVDHGLGIYSGYYHMSAVHVSPGQVVQAGDLVGEVGTLGLSTGNHLHWDLLARATWIDASAWEEQNLGCWLLDGWGTPCLP